MILAAGIEVKSPHTAIAKQAEERGVVLHGRERTWNGKPARPPRKKILMLTEWIFFFQQEDKI
jgi:hypothetical protein